MTRAARGVGIAALVSLLVAVPARGAGDATSSAGEEDGPEALLREAFENQYELDHTAEIELIMRSRSGQEQRRSFEAAAKRIGGRLHSIGRLTHPEHLRGMTILQIEAPDRGHDAFVYLPSMRSVRRVSTAQRGDAFFGTDVSYEDLERRHARDYRVVGFRPERLGEERVQVLVAQPVRARAYHEAHFFIATSDRAMLRADFFKRGATRPYRVIQAPRAFMKVAAGHTLPTRLVVENRARGTRTEVSYHRLRVDPEIDDRVFSIQTLERRGRIPGAP